MCASWTQLQPRLIPWWNPYQVDNRASPQWSSFKLAPAISLVFRGLTAMSYWPSEAGHCAKFSMASCTVHRVLLLHKWFTETTGEFKDAYFLLSEWLGYIFKLWESMILGKISLNNYCNRSMLLISFRDVLFCQSVPSLKKKVGEAGEGKKKSV